METQVVIVGLSNEIAWGESTANRVILEIVAAVASPRLNRGGGTLGAVLNRLGLRWFMVRAERGRQSDEGVAPFDASQANPWLLTTAKRQGFLCADGMALARLPIYVWEIDLRSPN